MKVVIKISRATQKTERNFLRRQILSDTTMGCQSVGTQIGIWKRYHMFISAKFTVVNLGIP